MVSLCCIYSMPHVIDDAGLYLCTGCTLCTNQFMYTETGSSKRLLYKFDHNNDQCKLDSGGERWSGFGDKRGEFHLHIFPILRFIFLIKTFKYTDTTYYLD